MPLERVIAIGNEWCHEREGHWRSSRSKWRLSGQDHETGSTRCRMGAATMSSMVADPRDNPKPALQTRDIYLSDLHIDTLKVKSRNFH